ncbi:VOC family protein [Nonomuraea sp. NPDC005650]|uniref:VOC family protein n=1 Tax=Nonomuraea sp. NPDC005650 TaxID=3157045 RepID=UPI0033AA1061
MSNPIVHFSVVGQDPDALARFYTETFGWGSPRHPDPASSFLQTGEAGDLTGVVKPDELGDPTPRVTMWIEVDDLDAALRRIEALGGRAVGATAVLSQGPRVARFADPEGNVMGLAERGREKFAEFQEQEARRRAGR